MNLLTAILDGMVEFVRRNPLTCLIILILAIGAPALLKGIAMFVLYFVLGCAVLVLILVSLFRWRVYKVRKQMEEQFGQRPQNPFGSPFGGARREEPAREGDVKIYKTADTPQKKVSKDVGDYVEFEESEK